MIATYFQWRVASENREEFQRRWREATVSLLDEGSNGSSLWQSKDGDLCAFALWPDHATRDAAFTKVRDEGQLESLSELIADPIARIDLDELENHWRLLTSANPQKFA